MKNGIDISKCRYWQDIHTEDDDVTIANFCNASQTKCENNFNCYYKQLSITQSQYNKLIEQNKQLQKQLEQKNQEIEDLKLSINNAEETIEELEEQLSDFLEP